MAKEELVPYGFKIPRTKSDKIVEYAERRGVKYSVILNEAVTEYIERIENPEIIEDQILQVLEKKPLLLEGHVRSILEKIAAQQLSK